MNGAHTMIVHFLGIHNHALSKIDNLENSLRTALVEDHIGTLQITMYYIQLMLRQNTKTKCR